MANLAIKGHATRGKEVIEILEMLGGRNDRNYIGELSNYIYTINEYGIIDWYILHEHDFFQYDTFTLEEFLEKFPYKVGDKVQHKGATSYGSIFEVEKMQWDGEKVKYIIRYLGGNYNCKSTVTVKDLQPFKEETMDNAVFNANAQCCDIMNHLIKKETIEGKITKNEDEGTLVTIDLTREFRKADDIEVILGDYEFVLKDGKTYFVKRYKYPKTYEECCKVLMGKTNFQEFDLVLAKLTMNKNEDNTISPEPPYITSINSLYKLLICRDAYWKIAGEQMGVGKPWKPDWTTTYERKYCIVNTMGKIEKLVQKTANKNLAFPTAEMRDVFYENFKNLIEECKEFL